MTTEAEIIAKHLPIISTLDDEFKAARAEARAALEAFHRAKPSTSASWEAWSAFEIAKSKRIAAERKLNRAYDARSADLKKFKAANRQKWFNS
jgi:hypothetical protein